VSPLSLLTFFAAAKKVSAAPHRGNANRPLRIQGKAKILVKQPKSKPTPEENQKKAINQTNEKKAKN
jgi:general secretion pathway protein K